MTTYRVAIVGCRARGTTAASAYSSHPRTELVGLCDLLEERLHALGDQFGVTARFADLDEMIRQTRPDIVVVSTAAPFHHPIALRILEHGIHVDVEKPICLDLVQGDELRAKAAENGAELAVHHQWWVSSWARAVNEQLRQGRIGEPRYMLASDKGYYGGFGIMEIGTHLIHQMIQLGGTCRSVVAQATTDGRPIEPADVLQAPRGNGIIAGEHITATLQFEGHLTGSLLCHRFTPMDRDAMGVEIVGSEGRLLWTMAGAWWLPQAHALPGGESWQPLEPIFADGFGADPSSNRHGEGDYWFVEEYVRALDEGRPHPCNGERALHTLEIMMGIFEAAAHGRRVQLPQENRNHPLLEWREQAGLPPPEPAALTDGEWLAAEDARLGR